MQAAPKLLSICVPVYGREEFLPAFFNSIPDSYLDKVEICISENPAPKDLSPEFIAKYRNRFPHFHYEKRDRNYGFTNNLLHVVSMASGKYCWTVGSDDWLTPDALDIICRILEKETPSILIANQIAITKDKKCQWHKYWLPSAIQTYKFSFGDSDKMMNYFGLSQGISAVGAFISSNIFERELWLNTKVAENIAADYIHMNKITAMTLSGDKSRCFMYIRDHIVYATIENDAVFSNDWSAKHRLMVDLRAITEIADAYIGDPVLRWAFIKILRRQHPFVTLYRTAVIPDMNEIEMNLLKRIFPPWQILVCRHLGYRRGGTVFHILKWIKRVFCRK